MIKLKTLKDFYDDIDSFKIHPNDKMERFLTLKMIRQEAVKWAYKTRDLPEVSNWILHFFNISEEDLKEAKEDE